MKLNSVKTVGTMLIMSGFLSFYGCNSRDTQSLHHSKANIGKDNKAEIEKKEVILEPDEHFKNALVAYAKNDFEKSYEEINKAIRYMEGIEAAAFGKEKEAIDNSIDDLTDLAVDIRGDRVDGVDEINYFFAKAGKALAGNRIKIIEDLNANNNTDSIQYHLDIALAQMENSKKYYGKKFSETEQQILADAKNVSRQLLAKENVRQSTIKKMTDNLRKTLNNLGEINQHFENTVSKNHNNMKAAG